MNILLVTRTNWDEPPRIRHQVANLFREAGHDVIFSQKPLLLHNTFFHGSWPACNPPAIQGLELISPIELVHHQLRLLPQLHSLNAYVASRSLKKELRRVSAVCPVELIVNFNYDSFWLKAMFPGLPIITVVNDDFEAACSLPFSTHITWVLKRTCRMSDAVFAVSDALCNRLSNWCNPELLLPWSPTPYVHPASSKCRSTLLFWGYINNRIDFDRLNAFAAAILAYKLPWKLRLVGPISQSAWKAVERLASYPFVEICPPTPLGHLVIDDCLAAIIPYRTDMGTVKACQLPNKALQLLSLGLPIVCSDMPAFQRASFVFRYGNGLSSLLDCLEDVSSEFWNVQALIKEFVNSNLADKRLTQLMMIIDKANGAFS